MTSYRKNTTGNAFCPGARSLLCIYVCSSIVVKAVDVLHRERDREKERPRKTGRGNVHVAQYRKNLTMPYPTYPESRHWHGSTHTQHLFAARGFGWTAVGPDSKERVCSCASQNKMSYTAVHNMAVLGGSTNAMLQTRATRTRRATRPVKTQHEHTDLQAACPAPGAAPPPLDVVVAAAASCFRANEVAPRLADAMT